MHNNVPAQLMFSTPAKFCKAMPRFCTPVLIVNPSPCSCRIYANFSVQMDDPSKALNMFEFNGENFLNGDKNKKCGPHFSTKS